MKRTRRRRSSSFRMHRPRGAPRCASTHTATSPAPARREGPIRPPWRTTACAEMRCLLRSSTNSTRSKGFSPSDASAPRTSPSRRSPRRSTRTNCAACSGGCDRTSSRGFPSRSSRASRRLSRLRTGAAPSSRSSTSSGWSTRASAAPTTNSSRSGRSSRPPSSSTAATRTTWDPTTGWTSLTPSSGWCSSCGKSQRKRVAGRSASRRCRTPG